MNFVWEWKSIYTYSLKNVGSGSGKKRFRIRNNGSQTFFKKHTWPVLYFRNLSAKQNVPQKMFCYFLK